MSEKEKYIKYNAFRLLCLQNASDALRGAENLINKDLNHLVYHLCILSLEELGKIFMAWMKITQIEKWGHQTPNIVLEDHEKKLFFAIWGPSIGTQVITKIQWDENKKMAAKLHALRLHYLYGSLEDSTESARKISNDEAEHIFKFVNSRLELSRVEGAVKEDGNENENSDMRWFNMYLQSASNSAFAFGEIGQKKMIEIGNVNEWIKWLKRTYEKENEESYFLAQHEIKRQPPSISEEHVAKWEFTIKVNVPSHSIRAKELSSFNNFQQPFKLYVGKDAHTLVIKHKLPSAVSVQTLWSQGWFTSKLLVAALNIATRGLFYWHAVRDIDRFYESLLDIASGKQLTVSINAKFDLNWEDLRMYLTEEHLHLSNLVYEYFLQLKRKDEIKDVINYMAGVAMFARSDIHLNLHQHEFMVFFDVYINLIKKHEVLRNNANIYDIGLEQIQGLLKGKDEYYKNMTLAENVRAKSATDSDITLTEVCAMKMYCDIYFLTLAVRVTQKSPGIILVPDPQ